MSDLQEKIKEVLELKEKCYNLALKFASSMMQYGGTLYSGIIFLEDGFSFTYGPGTHGLGMAFTMPYSVLENPESLSDIVKSEKEKIEHLNKKNRCETCGQLKPYMPAILDNRRLSDDTQSTRTF
jgi:hypothetical protein